MAVARFDLVAALFGLSFGEVLDNLLKPETKAMLRRVLTYHVVPGK